ncbi:MAG TPA: porin family protein [Candidatus Kapabacteria bacterium]|nr:porin family protein [Candidatus Kapabacteria bacterium]
MNKKTAISASLLLLFAIAGPLRAQYASSWWGLRAGVNLANESITIPNNFDASIGIKPGVIGGLVFEHWFDDTWGFSASLLFDQRGTSAVYASSAVNREIEIDTANKTYKLYSGNDNFSLSYLEIPLMLKYSFGEGDIRPYIAIGPSFGFLVSASESVTGDLTPISTLKDSVQSFHASIYGGLGLADELYHGPMITFDAGYAAGLTKIFKTTPNSRAATDGRPFPQPIDLSSAKASDIVITVGIMWKL